MEAKGIKLAYIGGGSRGWARLIMTDLALCPHLEGEIALYDTDYDAAWENVEHAARLFGHPDARTSFDVYACKQLREALEGADFVVISILPGPIEMFANDIDIPAKYGILQTVGDTTGPGGISRALRAGPVFLDYAHQITAYCPEAWVINYTNPMSLCTWALYAAEPGIKAFGCCHEVFGTQHRLADLVHEQLEVSRPKRQEIKLDVAGVNHFTFATAARWNGMDLFPLIEAHLGQEDFWSDQTDWALAWKRAGAWFDSRWRVACDFFRRFGVLGAAGDRHLVEFVPWYLLSEEALHRYGVILTPSSYRLGTWQPSAEARTAESEQQPGGTDLQRSDEEGVDQMLALLGIQPLDTNVNLPNLGQIPELPLGAMVETNAQFRNSELRPLVPEPLPTGVLSLLRRVVDVQEMTLEAAIYKDRDLAFQALLNDPLCCIPTDQAWEMFKELLAANRDMLPGWE
jgi:alpha-galactosidase